MSGSIYDSKKKYSDIKKLTLLEKSIITGYYTSGQVPELI